MPAKIVRALMLPLLALAAAPLAAQAAPKIAVIDSDRIVAESVRGKQALERLKQVQDQKLAEGKQMQQEITDLRKRLEEGRLSLAPDKLDELKKQYDSKVVGFRRFSEDADAELGKMRDEALEKIEKDVLTVINQVGAEQGYTLIFNKFRSGLVFATDAVDITDVIIQRFDAAAGAGKTTQGR